MHIDLNQKNLTRLWLILAVAFVTVELLIYGINLFFFGKPTNWYQLFYEPLNYLMWILFLPLVFRMHSTLPLNQQSAISFIRKHLPAAIGLCVFHRVCVEVVIIWLLQGLDGELVTRIHPLMQPKVFAVRVLTGGLGNLFLYVLSLAIVMLIGYQVRLKDELALRFQAERDKINAELRALKMQFSPHFLLNALNGAVSLVERQKSEAVEYLLCLGDMLHYTMAQEQQEAVPLGEEIAFAENYLRIQKMRYGSRLQFSFDINQDIVQIKVPPLLLQPLIENAVKHGLEQGPDVCSIVICTGLNPAGFFLEVTNNLQSQQTSRSAKKNAGRGLVNLTERLNLFYGKRVQFQTRAHADRFVARMEIRHD